MRHINRYRVSFSEALARALLTEELRHTAAGIESIRETLDDLYERGQIDRLPGISHLARNLVFLPGYQLKFPDIALVWHCFMEPERRYLVKYEELKTLFAGEPSLPFHNYRHVLSDCNGTPALMRVYNCRAQKKNAREQIQRHLTEHCKGFAHWLDEGSYQLSILVTSEGRKREIEKVISETYRTSPPLQEVAGIQVSIVPTEETFERMLGEAGYIC